MNKKFDYEYSTQNPKEMKWLLDNGIRYSFVKEIDGVTTYKYKKNRYLFEKLSKFYLEIPYWTEKDESYKNLIDNKIEEILWR